MWDRFTTEQLQSALDKAGRAAANHTRAGLLHFAELCAARAAELTAEIERRKTN